MEKEVTNQDTAGKVQNKVQCPNKECSTDEHSASMEEKHSEADVENRGDCKQESQKNEKPATIKETNSDTSHTRTQEASETTISPPQDDTKDDQIDGLKPEKKEEISATDNTQSGDDGESPEKEVLSVAEGRSPDKDGTQMEKKSDLSQADGKQPSPKNVKPVTIQEPKSDTSHTRTQEASETTISPPQDDTKDDQIDGLKPEKNEEISATDNTDCQSGDGEKKSDLSQADGKQSSPKNVKPVTIQEPKSDESHITKNEASELIIPQIVNEEKDDQVDEPKPKLKEKTSATNNSDNRSGEAPEETRDKHESTTQDKRQLDDRSNDVETIGPTTPEATQPEVPQVTGGSGKYLKYLAVPIVALAILVLYFPQPESPPQTNDVQKIGVFLRQLEIVKTLFPNQRTELWSRSRIHLQRHLEVTHPTEPVSLILTAGLRAEKTLSCLARNLASAFSSALNASVLHIDGASKASQDSDQVKLDIDRKLQGAFEGDKPVAVIHRFEELPPGSTLIFYRYCDHENAAYKKTFLIFTVLLGEEDEIPAKISLCAVEEMVDDHLQKKFLTHGHPVSFDMMDLDKYGGLWSRISHLILPVAAEERIELEGC